MLPARNSQAVHSGPQVRVPLIAIFLLLGRIRENTYFTFKTRIWNPPLLNFGILNLELKML